MQTKQSEKEATQNRTRWVWFALGRVTCHGQRGAPRGLRKTNVGNRLEEPAAAGTHRHRQPRPRSASRSREGLSVGVLVVFVVRSLRTERVQKVVNRLPLPVHPHTATFPPAHHHTTTAILLAVSTRLGIVAGRRESIGGEKGCGCQFKRNKMEKRADAATENRKTKAASELVGWERRKWKRRRKG